MVESLRALLKHAIDYAGMFPPANLALDEAAARYAEYRRGGDAFLLARFVCPAGRLSELELADDATWRISAVGRAADGAEQFFRESAGDLEQIAAFRERQGRRARTELFEVPLPKQIMRAARATDVETFFAAAADQFAGRVPDLATVLFEPALDDDGPQRLAAVATALAATNGPLAGAAGDAGPRFGLKLRLGGPAGAPGLDARQVARFIAVCRDARLPWKATAGLHQPLPARHAASGASAHGFINLLTAVVMAGAHQLPPAQIAQILDDARPASFVFREDALSWRDWRVSTQDIEPVREQSLLSFGSCSFDEPRAGLYQLGWL